MAASDDELAERLVALYPVLRCLSARALAELCQTASRVQLAAGAAVFDECQNCPGFPLILAGTIKVVKSTAAGREMLLYRVEPGDSCIITSSCLLGRSRYSARGIAELPLTLIVLPPPLFEQMIAEQPLFRDFVFHLFAERIAELMQLVEEVAFHRLDQRLAKLLLARGETVRATHQALADELGSVREIVSRLLKGLAGQGLVVLGREQISIVDREGLRQLADSGR
ncbi:MAG TPA: Crp/Fnr family transcriptional regulator [Accumulibacter sp.]|uniref:Crp/Fnr family transcriptional regulator n=1 Tax=Accumulibacter sp. TaxID=2053492 RepID=UPI0028799BAF|nr:Crp/Fnr family transcriptional regulator [Accumulibacter sp.]MDS4055877.1 Crp/Fnr family transcriptional regulator [Accumulibacter sp.]HMV04105.1 Crp/Fnr family transcriptional regulator [Accumulibacter sp.]HMW62521.1 Crp/Fnr family transcriptional regulator [Accumulibacter sp.]HMW80950.1 Crp/Fnr family transcriptional regulator [Accumulibacter sp.]HMX69213.1 Crp/Fnr family transcriptional regulator [Accumulibacter sp.]